MSLLEPAKNQVTGQVVVKKGVVGDSGILGVRLGSVSYS